MRMKRLIFPSIVVCVVMLFAGMGFAADIGFGVKGGIALAGYSGDDSDDFASKLGFHAGGFATMQLMDMLSLQPEVLFSAIGAKGDLSGFDGKYKENLSYIEIPVLVKFYPPISLPVALNIFAGPSLGINLSGKYTASGERMISKHWFLASAWEQELISIRSSLTRGTPWGSPLMKKISI